MITKVKFEGFKLLRDVEFALGRFNVIVGENGTGKSSILEGLHYLLQLAAPSMEGDREIGGRLAAMFRGDLDVSLLCSRPNAPHLRISVVADRVPMFGASWTRNGLHSEEGPFRMEFLREENGRAEGVISQSLSNRPGRTSFYDYPLLEEVGKLGLHSVLRLRLSATQLSKDHYTDDQAPRVEHDGTGLASVLQEVQNARDGRFERIEADLQKVVPGARRIRTTRAKIVRREKLKISVDGKDYWTDQEKPYLGAGIEVEWGNVGWVPARHLSEGTLLALGLCTVLHHRPPSLLLLDDLDKALHPKAQRELVQLLRTILAGNDQLQILATTHSPYVVDEFAPEDVLVVASLDGNSSQVRRLSEHPKANDKKQYLETGEFWSAVGERWAAEKRA